MLEKVLRGALNKQIADDLGICERTVKLHRTSITTKLGVPSVAELAQLARKPPPSLKGSSRCRQMGVNLAFLILVNKLLDHLCCYRR